jgi:hypothetical protein
MLRSFVFLCSAAIVLSSTASASDWTEPGGGVLAQIMDQGGARTTFTLVNLDAVAASYTLNFFGDNGLPLTLSTTAGAGVSLTGTIPANGSAEFETNGSASAALVEGYAELVTTGTIAGSAVFGLPIGSGFYESTCPLDTGTDYEFGIPFDHTTPGTVVGVALADSYGYAPLTIAVTAYDPTGKQLVPVSGVGQPERHHLVFRRGRLRRPGVFQRPGSARHRQHLHVDCPHRSGRFLVPKS